MRRLLLDVILPLAVFVGVILLFGWFWHATGLAHKPTPAQQASTHCATLDAIAVQTPESWVCVSKAVIPADTATESVMAP